MRKDFLMSWIGIHSTDVGALVMPQSGAACEWPSACVRLLLVLLLLLCCCCRCLHTPNLVFQPLFKLFESCLMIAW